MIRVLLLLFPRAWRRRYGRDLKQVVADGGGLTVQSTLDIASSAVRERLTSLGQTFKGGNQVMIENAWRHPTRWALVGASVVMPTAFFAIGSLLAYQMHVSALAGVMDTWTSGVVSQPVIAMLLAAAPLPAVFFALAPLVRFGGTAHESGRELAIGVRFVLGNWLVVASIGAITGLLASYAIAEHIA